ncbi:NAD-dependent epimerase/dehydratase family protein [Sphingorhabdus sp.]|uniref:NAD-dependent epimerase/dehydratase family protein n=1 Tax=Sphingorhabdus sp. TaxID=1902408 RepID=UPI0032B7F908
MAKEQIAVIGYGMIGQSISARLSSHGRAVRIIQRSRPSSLPAGAVFQIGDALDPESIGQAIKGCDAVVASLGFPYRGNVWERAWPTAIANILAACEAQQARLVFADNMYMYGPQTLPLTESMPIVDYRRKPKSRAAATRLWQQVHSDGRVQAVAVRSSDFYGSGVRQSIFGVPTLGLIAQDKTVLMTADPDFPHDVTHVEDYARAVVTLLDAPASDYGQAWHVPCSPTLTFRQFMQIAADTIGVELRLKQLNKLQTYLLGFLSRDVAEYREMHFLLDRPYLVDISRFRDRFWGDTVPFETGIARAVKSFRTPQQAV